MIGGQELYLLQKRSLFRLSKGTGAAGALSANITQGQVAVIIVDFQKMSVTGIFINPEFIQCQSWANLFAVMTVLTS